MDAFPHSSGSSGLERWYAEQLLWGDMLEEVRTESYPYAGGCSQVQWKQGVDDSLLYQLLNFARRDTKKKKKNLSATKQNQNTSLIYIRLHMKST